jgi:hypothetical protein
MNREIEEAPSKLGKLLGHKFRTNTSISTLLGQTQAQAHFPPANILNDIASLASA